MCGHCTAAPIGHEHCGFDWCSCPPCNDRAQTMFQVEDEGEVKLKRRRP